MLINSCKIAVRICRDPLELVAISVPFTSRIMVGAIIELMLLRLWVVDDTTGIKVNLAEHVVRHHSIARDDRATALPIFV